VPRAKLADATGLNSLLRQMGGSVGLAVFATLLSRYGVHARAAIAAHVTPERPDVVQRLAQLQAAFMSKGFDAVSAKAAALKALAGTVAQQATVMSFEKVFLLTGLLFLLVLPLLFFLKVNRSGPAEKLPAEILTE
jgi:DHA2 family multidrug resistance protein